MIDVKLRKNSHSLLLCYHLNCLNHMVEVGYLSYDIQPVLMMGWNDTKGNTNNNAINCIVSTINNNKGENGNFLDANQLVDIDVLQITHHHIDKSLSETIFKHFKEFSNNNFIIDENLFKDSFPLGSWLETKEKFGKEYISRVLPSVINNSSVLRSSDYKNRWSIEAEYFFMNETIPINKTTSSIKKF